MYVLAASFCIYTAHPMRPWFPSCKASVPAGESPIVKLGVTTSADFSETEIKVLRMVCEGLEYSEIAEELHYTRDNVKYHIGNILQKTGYANKPQLAIAVTGKRFIIPKLFDEQDGSEENPIVL